MQNIQIQNTKKRKHIKDFQWRQKKTSNCAKKRYFGRFFSDSEFERKRKQEVNFLIE